MIYRLPDGYRICAIVLITMALFVLSCTEEDITGLYNEDPKVDPDPPADTLKVLFIGSSYTHYFDLPGMFEQLARNAGKTVFVDRILFGGQHLTDLCRNTEVSAKIKTAQWDYVSLQGGSGNLVYPELWPQCVGSGLDCLCLRISSNCETSIPVYFMPWAFKDGVTWVEGYTDTYEVMQQKIYDETLSMAESRDLMIAPVGMAWKSVIAFKPEMDLFDPDKSHPSLEGSYLAACVFFSTLFQEALDDNPFYGGLPEEDALYLQSAASTEVLFRIQLYNIVPPYRPE